MASSADRPSHTENEFDIPLNLSPSAAISALPQAAEDQASYQVAPRDRPSSRKKGKDKVTGDGNATPAPSGTTSAAATPNAAAPKPKRVRTGCLTCRERHLKCDEALPRCQNCQKSDRNCKRGVRLNFIDTQVSAPPYTAQSTREWRVNFCDESRDIASEYVGGPQRYPPPRRKRDAGPPLPPYGYTPADSLRLHPHVHHTLQPTPPTSSLFPPFSEPTHNEIPEPIFQTTPQHPSESPFPEHQTSRSSPRNTLIPSNNPRPYLNTPEEVLLMQVFVEEVGLWMDSMDAMKHFTHILPYHALGEPMLLNAFLACGARHLFLVNPSYGEERALYYYNTSTRDLLSYLQNPHRDPVLTATTAVVLNVYEIMCERAIQRMNHIAGARALIKECRWDAKSVGIGAACFWLNVGMELLSCLHFNWKMAWDPDLWGVDMNMVPSQIVAGEEELWTHRIIYICAKIANFRATEFHMQGHDGSIQHRKLVQRCEEWNRLKNWCDEWVRCVPRSMLPLGYLPSWQTNSKSSFPEVWLVKRTSIVARLFYHTACLVISKHHPTEPEFSEQMVATQQTHAHDICGIVAHVKDRGVASVSLRCLAIAAECLVTRTAQEEVLRILDKVIKETGWQVGCMQKELCERWGFSRSPSQTQTQTQQQQHQHQHQAPLTPHPHHNRQQQQQQPPPPQDSTTTLSTSPPDLSSSLLNSSEPATLPRPRMPQGIINPLMATADFSYENHPYQNHYVAPQNSQLNNYQYGSY